MKKYVISVKYTMNYNGSYIPLISSFVIAAVDVSQEQAYSIARILFPGEDNIDVELKKIVESNW